MKLGVSHQTPEQLTDEHLAYLKQMGVESLEVRTLREYSSFDDLLRIKDRVEGAGLALHEVMLADTYTAPEVTLGLDGRDETIALFQRFLRDLGRAGIPHTTYAWHTGGAYQTGTSSTRGCPTRLFRLDNALALPNPYGRTYSDEDMWRTFEHFIGQVLPVAEDAGVRLQLHPNDPPVSHQGVAHIFRSPEAFRRAMDLSDHSPYSGLLFCAGCFAEMFGPDGEGKDIVAAIREFGYQGHIFQVHYRNIDANLPDFHETFPDEGYVDMVAIMRALEEVGYQGMVVPDHVPDTSGGEGGARAGEAFTFGYIRALIQAAKELSA